MVCGPTKNAQGLPRNNSGCEECTDKATRINAISTKISPRRTQTHDTHLESPLKPVGMACPKRSHIQAAPGGRESLDFFNVIKSCSSSFILWLNWRVTKTCILCSRCRSAMGKRKLLPRGPRHYPGKRPYLFSQTRWVDGRRCVVRSGTRATATRSTCSPSCTSTLSGPTRRGTTPTGINHYWIRTLFYIFRNQLSKDHWIIQSGAATC